MQNAGISASINTTYSRLTFCLLRSRSRSPGHEARARLPPEILQQLEFGLVEPSPETLQGEIPFTKVETARHYNPRSRQLKTATTRSVVSAMEATASNVERLNRAETRSMTGAAVAAVGGLNHQQYYSRPPPP